MSRASERQAKDLQHVRDQSYAKILHDLSVTPAIITAVATVLDRQAGQIAEDRRTAWQSRSKARAAAAEAVRELVALLDAHPTASDPEHPNPHRHPLTVEQMRAHPMSGDASPASDANLEAAFGPLAQGAVTRMMELPKTFDWTDGTEPPAELHPAIRNPSIFGGFNGPGGCACVLTESDNPERPNVDDSSCPIHKSPGEHRVGDTVTVAGIDGTAYGPSQPPVDAVELADPVEPGPAPREPRERLTYAQVAEIGRTRNRGAELRSPSQVSQFGECGTRYALRDHERVPSWSLVGGLAVHAAAAAINSVASVGGQHFDAPSDDVSVVWDTAFHRIVAETEIVSRVVGSDWYAANKGAEAYDWWRVEGQSMLQRYVDFLRSRLNAGWRIATVDSRPVIEWRYELPVQGLPVPHVCILDVALEHTVTGAMLVVDLKTGRQAPTDRNQLIDYGWALWYARRTTDQASPKVGAGWFMARTGKSELAYGDVTTETSWQSVVHRVTTMDQLERAGAYVSRPSRFCSTCGVRDLCPDGPL